MNDRGDARGLCKVPPPVTPGLKVSSAFERAVISTLEPLLKLQSDHILACSLHGANVADDSTLPSLQADFVPDFDLQGLWPLVTHAAFRILHGFLAGLIARPPAWRGGR